MEGARIVIVGVKISALYGSRQTHGRKLKIARLGHCPSLAILEVGLAEVIVIECSAQIQKIVYIIQTETRLMVTGGQCHFPTGSCHITFFPLIAIIGIHRPMLIRCERGLKHDVRTL